MTEVLSPLDCVVQVFSNYQLIASHVLIPYCDMFDMGSLARTCKTLRRACLYNPEYALVLNTEANKVYTIDENRLLLATRLGITKPFIHMFQVSYEEVLMKLLPRLCRLAGKSGNIRILRLLDAFIYLQIIDETEKMKIEYPKPSRSPPQDYNLENKRVLTKRSMVEDVFTRTHVVVKEYIYLYEEMLMGAITYKRKENEDEQEKLLREEAVKLTDKWWVENTDHWERGSTFFLQVNSQIMRKGLWKVVEQRAVTNSQKTFEFNEDGTIVAIPQMKDVTFGVAVISAQLKLLVSAILSGNREAMLRYHFPVKIDPFDLHGYATFKRIIGRTVRGWTVESLPFVSYILAEAGGPVTRTIVYEEMHGLYSNPEIEPLRVNRLVAGADKQKLALRLLDSEKVLHELRHRAIISFLAREIIDLDAIPLLTIRCSDQTGKPTNFYRLYDEMYDNRHYMIGSGHVRFVTAATWFKHPERRRIYALPHTDVEEEEDDEEGERDLKRLKSITTTTPPDVLE